MINLPSLVFALVMGFLMSLSITFATTFVRVGSAQNFYSLWFEVWLVAYPVAIVCILIYRPLASRITAKVLAALNFNKP
jgi:ABC-type thiamin/hydroxymethylpyrimidine transport system permease subunit